MDALRSLYEMDVRRSPYGECSRAKCCMSESGKNALALGLAERLSIQLGLRSEPGSLDRYSLRECVGLMPIVSASLP